LTQRHSPHAGIGVAARRTSEVSRRTPGDLRTHYRGLAAPIPRGEESPGLSPLCRFLELSTASRPASSLPSTSPRPHASSPTRTGAWSHSSSRRPTTPAEIRKRVRGRGEYATYAPGGIASRLSRRACALPRNALTPAVGDMFTTSAAAQTSGGGETGGASAEGGRSGKSWSVSASAFTLAAPGGWSWIT
jgi:hypothetical protein